MDPFSLWLVGGVVIPDAYERAINSLSSKSADRLAKSIRADVGGYPKQVFHRWYRTRETWEGLVQGGQVSFDTLVDRLVAIAADGFGTELPRDRAEAIVRSAVTGFMGSLDPSGAADVADYRSAQRDRLIDENAETRDRRAAPPSR